MTISSIVYGNVDDAYPIAGQDNDSQGFRDNFSAIKIGLQVANTNFTDLSTNTAKLNVNNNFNGVLIDNAVTNRLTGTVNNAGSSSGTVYVSFDDGEYQVFTITGTSTISFKDWPVSDRYAKIRVHLVSNLSSQTISAFASEGAVTPKFDNSFPGTFTLSGTGAPKIVEAWTYNGGATVYVKYLGEFA